jgi:hypothetical protein
MEETTIAILTLPVIADPIGNRNALYRKETRNELCIMLSSAGGGAEGGGG